MLGKKVWFPLALFLLLVSAPFTVNADEDAADGEVIDEDAEKEEKVDKKVVTDNANEQAARDSNVIGPARDAHVSVLFTSPVNTKDFVAGQIVKVLIGFANKGEKDFIVQASDTSFRYPMDFSYTIQNFTAARYHQVVQPKQEATFDYSFIPSDAFIGRPLGLVINLHYSDVDGTLYRNAVFNETVNIVEDESSFSTETGFLYLVLFGIAVLLLLVGQHFLSKFTRKQPATYQPVHEVGTNSNEVDYEWIPRTNFLEKKSPRTRRPVKAN